MFALAPTREERQKHRRAEVDAKPKLLCIDIGATCMRGSCATGKVQRIHYIFIFSIEVTISQSLSLNFLYSPYRVLSLVDCFGFNGPLRQYFSLYRAGACCH